MPEYSIEARGLGKRYRIGASREQLDTLSATLVRAVRQPRRLIGGFGRPAQVDFWALQDVSFDLRPGEVLGVVGRNGAGKSTLLKVLSRVASPTTGSAVIRGSLGSLLEVGTGFHPELTGRENIFLNGAVLGMDRAHIATQFDAIVDFAGIGDFIDTPVKRFSSGMYLRLAFAVAAHLEPDILIVDEVLAVGDAAFQAKCIGKIAEVTTHGRTVLFVSHNMAAVQRLCTRAIMLVGGRVVQDGSPHEVVQAYLNAGDVGSGQRLWDETSAVGSEGIFARRLTVSQNGNPVSRVDMLLPFSVEIEYDVHQPTKGLTVDIQLSGSDGEIVLTTAHSLEDTDLTDVEPGRYVSVCHFPPGALNAGTYWITAQASRIYHYHREFWRVEHALAFEVELSCAKMAKRDPGTFRGPVGPRLVSWSRESLHDETGRSIR